jgi:hypothetical protein
MKVYQQGCLMLYCGAEIVGKQSKFSIFFLIAGLDCKVSCNLKVLEISTTELEKISKNFDKIKK